MAVAVGPGRNDQHRPPKQQAKDADKHVGRRIREWRMMLGVSQRTLAGQIGVTSQQLRKYERGAHRISAASLYRVARSLGVGIDCFFGGPAKGSELVPVPQQRLLLDLTRSFAGIVRTRRRRPRCPSLPAPWPPSRPTKTKSRRRRRSSASCGWGRATQASGDLAQKQSVFGRTPIVLSTKRVLSLDHPFPCASPKSVAAGNRGLRCPTAPRKKRLGRGWRKKGVASRSVSANHPGWNAISCRAFLEWRSMDRGLAKLQDGGRR